MHAFVCAIFQNQFGYSSLIFVYFITHFHLLFEFSVLKWYRKLKMFLAKIPKPLYIYFVIKNHELETVFKCH